MKGISFRQRFNYWFDNTMSRGTAALIGWLFAISALLILAIAFLVWITRIDPGRRGFLDLVWASLLRTLDPGTMGGDSGGAVFLLSMLAVTLGGVFVVSLRIGILTSGIEGKLEQLRKGRSQIVEQGHTVILGWSPKVFSIVSELVIANANQPRSCIAILAPQDKIEMETEIMEKVGSTGRTRIVCRTGNPIDLTDLEIIRPHTARSVIILAQGGTDSDIQTIKTILALTNNPNRRAEKYHIVAEIRDPRMLSQISENKRLAAVFRDLFDPEGSELYLKPVGDYVDTARPVNFYTVVEAARQRGETAIGYRIAAESGNPGKAYGVMINPAKSEKFIFLAEDRVTVLAES